MTTVTGYVKQISDAAADSIVTAENAIAPVVHNGSLQQPGKQSTKGNPATGFWQMNLGFGTYWISVTGARVLITVGADHDGETVSFEQLIVSSLPTPQAPVGGDQPNASSTVLGLVKLDENPPADGLGPVVPTGFYWKADNAAVRAIPNRSNNKIVFVSSTDEEWDWAEDSTSAESANVLKPDDTEVGEPGRWLKRASGGGGGSGGGSEVVDDLAGMKALTSSASLKHVIIHTPEAGVGKEYYFVFGDSTAVDPDDPYKVIAPDDDGGRFFFLA